MNTANNSIISNRTGTSFEDARARGIVWTRVYFDYLMGILDARAVANFPVLNQPTAEEY